jgi:N6-adenosine-specific RNA methylase IME4
MDFPNKTYDIILLDPPWPYYGDPNKNCAAGKHYTLMTVEEINNLPIRSLLNKPGAVFCWATSPRLHFAVDAIKSWGLHYRGIAHTWVKTRKDGGIISGQGIKATYSKPTTELLLLATTNKTGRPFKVLDEAMGQVVLTPRGGHSVKPPVFRELIVKTYGDKSRIELFARTKPEGWDVWGDEVVDNII